jgi:hypothetical protein
MSSSTPDSITWAMAQPYEVDNAIDAAVNVLTLSAKLR